jgi:hypothetical protein
MIHQTGRLTWYDNLPTAQDKATQRAYAGWLAQYPWQLYVTLTFAYKLAHASAWAQYRTFINNLERYYRNPIGYFCAAEDRAWSGCGLAATKIHFHGLLCSDASLNPDYVETAWNRLGHFDGNALATPYDPTGNAAQYCTKFVEQSGDWDADHLRFFQGDTEQQNHRTRRRSSRQQARQRHNCLPVPGLRGN